jgi:uncharacterized membrane protein
VGNLLRIGLGIATAVVGVGAAIYLVRHGGEQPQYRVFSGEPADLRGIRGIVREALDLRGRGAIQLGLLLLMATPVMRVAFSVLAFALQRDRLYVAITLAVLVVLLYSTIGGYA